MRKLGSYGGKATVKKHGKKHMRKIVKDRWEREKAADNKVDI